MNVDKETLHIVVNPAAGHGIAPELINEYVVPLLTHLSVPYEVHTTTRATHERDIAKSIYQAAKGKGAGYHRERDGSRKIPVLIGGGDGTAHEFVQGVLEAQGDSHSEITTVKVDWELIVVPAGSGNALFASLFPPGTSPSSTTRRFLASLPSSLSSAFTDQITYQLSSLFSFISREHHALPLPLTRTTLLPSLPGYANSPSDLEAQREAPSITSHIVLSTSLHAAILHTSEKLRQKYPGVERFKVAAQQNVTSLFNARMKLYPSVDSSNSQASAADRDVVDVGVDVGVGESKPTATTKKAMTRRPVEQYDPRTGRWISPFTADPDARSTEEWDEEAGIWALEGPFAYVVSTATVDRFESNFVISPLTSLRRSTTATAATSTADPTGAAGQTEIGSGSGSERAALRHDLKKSDLPSHLGTHHSEDRTDQSQSQSEFTKGGDASHPYIYLTILRPTRDPLIKSTPLARRGSVWSKRAFQVIGQAYEGGKHVDLTFPPQPESEPGWSATAASGRISIAALIQKRKEAKEDLTQLEDENVDDESSKLKLEEKGEGEVVVESFRVGGFDWIPYIFPASATYATSDVQSEPISPSDRDTAADDLTTTGTKDDSAVSVSVSSMTTTTAKKDSDNDGYFTTGDARLVCADGAIYHLPDGGVAQVRLLADTDTDTDTDDGVSPSESEERSSGQTSNSIDSTPKKADGKARFFVYA
ncbi:hypothetical protein IAU59_000273 [Kwoniella sp. CBS 9459]